MLSKGMVESFLLSKDEPLTSNIDKVMGFEVLEGGLKIRKLANIGFLGSAFIFKLKTRKGKSIQICLS